MSKTKVLHVSVITPSKAVLEGDAQSLSVPAFDGEMGVLPGHAPMLALLGTGELRVTGTDGQVKRLAVRGGFLQIKDNAVTVLTQEAVSVSDLNDEALQAEAHKLEGQKPTKLPEREALTAKRAWVKAQMKLKKS